MGSGRLADEPSPLEWSLGLCCFVWGDLAAIDDGALALENGMSYFNKYPKQASKTREKRGFKTGRIPNHAWEAA